MKTLMTGNEAAAMGARMSRPQVIAAYPITPQTSIAEKLAGYTARKEIEARYIKVESETSAMAACIGGSLSGARVFTATSSQGLALMHELLHWAAGARLPVVLVNVNRSMAAPWSLGVDHNDTLSQRDTGCLQIYCETAQEVLDTVPMAYALAEKALLPVLICMDGFLLSHYTEPVDLPNQEDVDRFLPRRRADYRMDPNRPFTFGGGVSAEVLYGLRRRMQQDMDAAPALWEKINRRFRKIFARSLPAVETHGMEGSDLALVTNGTMAGTVKAYLRDRGAEKGVGLVKMRFFRPFPTESLRKVLEGCRAAVVVDRDLSPGGGGIFAQEVRAALHGTGPGIPVVSVIGGLGGVDVTPDHLDRLVTDLRSRRELPFETLWMEV
ncbi:MAG: pyruvate ferredoxin oxidoreductase [Deltaproteobacteria bacterium]|nr:pyruvate ferredoxin oxidoreductase [Deltaproteobacteria bacterium]